MTIDGTLVLAFLSGLVAGLVVGIAGTVVALMIMGLRQERTKARLAAAEPSREQALTAIERRAMLN